MKSPMSAQQKTKVIHSFPIWLPLTQTWMYNQVRYLTGDIENHIVCERMENLEQFYLPNIHSLNDSASKWRYIWDKSLRKLKLRQHLGYLVEIAKKQGATVLHSHFGQIGWANLAAVKQAKLKHIVTFYGEDVNRYPQNPLWRQRFQQLFAQVDLILCEGSFMAESIINLGCPAEKVKVHHLGVNVEQIEFKPRLWNGNEPLRVLISASFREKKGIPYALEALGRIKQQVPLEITIIGDARHGDDISQGEKTRILNTIDRYHLKSQVNLLGYQPYKVFYEQAYKNHVFVSPSVTAANGDTEGGAPVSIIENIATGMPVVSTTHCDIPEVTKNSVKTLLAAERDVDGLVKMFNWLINHPQKWRDMLNNGREYVEQEYDARKQGQRLANIYQLTDILHYSQSIQKNPVSC